MKFHQQIQDTSFEAQQAKSEQFCKAIAERVSKQVARDMAREKLRRGRNILLSLVFGVVNVLSLIFFILVN